MDRAESRGRKAWYLMALWAGLRRSELLKVTWGDIDLERSLVTMRVGKAHREDIVPLHPELVAELQRVRPQDVLPTARVFPEEVTNQTRRRDFERAGIPLVDAHGRHADMHALRSTLGTMLARCGVTSQVGPQIVRHADYRTTLQHYTRLELVDAEGAIGKMLAVSSAAMNERQPQQIPRQSAHGSALAGATPVNEDSQQSDPDGERKARRELGSRDVEQPDATPDGDGELVAVGPNPV